MSVDLVGSIRNPVPLDLLVAAARDTLTQLLGLSAAPAIEVTARRRYQRGEVVDAGHLLSEDELASELVGTHLLGPPLERSSASFDFGLRGYHDFVRLMVFDHCDPLDPGGEDNHVDAVDACFMPQRTCVGVLLATALALAAATRGDGEFVDIEISMLEPPVGDPVRVIELTKLPDAGDDFETRCVRYMRQFPNLDGWPADPSLTSG